MIDDTRKKYIDGVVDSLKDRYQTSDCFDWRRLSQENRILHLDSSRFFVPMSLRLGGIGVIVTNPLIRSRSGIDYTAHEYGHYFLGHTDEDNFSSQYSEDNQEIEANYFAQELVGEVGDDIAPWWRQVLAELSYPVAAYKSTNGESWGNYVQRFVQRKVRRELLRRHFKRRLKKFGLF